MDHLLKASPARTAIDQRTLYEGNSILRGGRDPVVEEPKRAMEDLVIE